MTASWSGRNGWARNSINGRAMAAVTGHTVDSQYASLATTRAQAHTRAKSHKKRELRWHGNAGRGIGLVSVERVESKRVDDFASMSDEELRGFVYSTISRL